MITDFTKQTELIDVENFNERINIIGCGALGSWIVFFLLKMGFKNIHVYDYDEIVEHNLPNQMFKEKDIGSKKVEAIYSMYKDFFNENDDRLKIHDTKVTAQNTNSIRGIVMCAVDSMGARKTLYEQIFKYGSCDLFIEGRLSIYGGYVYTLTKNIDTNKYEETLYKDEDAEVSACGISQTALPAAVNVATMMIQNMIMIKTDMEENIYNYLMYSIPQLDTMKGRW